MKSFKLCYVSGNFAYFTSQAVDKQRGDDWNDAPYEHNAGMPYSPCWHNSPHYLHNENRGYKQGTTIPLKPGELCRKSCCVNDWDDQGNPMWEIKLVAFNGDFEQPCDNYTNSPYSVQSINKGEVPWLQNSLVKIYAGVEYDEFCTLIWKGLGSIFEEVR